MLTTDQLPWLLPADLILPSSHLMELRLQGLHQLSVDMRKMIDELPAAPEYTLSTTHHLYILSLPEQKLGQPHTDGDGKAGVWRNGGEGRAVRGPQRPAWARRRWSAGSAFATSPDFIKALWLSAPEGLEMCGLHAASMRSYLGLEAWQSLLQVALC